MVVFCGDLLVAWSHRIQVESSCQIIKKVILTIFQIKILSEHFWYLTINSINFKI